MFALNIDGPVRLVQITDTHLNGPEDGHLLGMKTLHSLRCVLDIVRNQRDVIDAFLVTGDLSQDGSLQAYHHLQNELRPFDCPSFWLEGNHDYPENMIEAARGYEHLDRVIRTSHWQIIMLNSQVVTKVHGYLEQDQLDLLQQALSERPDLHSLVCFHHHPIDMGCKWIDTIGVKNADELWRVIDQHKNVRAVLWGHVHQDSDQMRGDVRLMSTPSTCIQFEPKTEDFSIDQVAPGYRWLDLNPDGSIDTAVSRVEGIEFEVDYSVKGY
ncbi:MAG: 3',5'-cyclic-AMP phosphodiesterase [Saccharospirillaceae bacterium]|nr:3',5'-cyclic-AMP phosphodiesterase [Saccharospirillaceae bacterium]